jgi:hypothetical protein
MIAMIAAGIVCLFLARAVIHKLTSPSEFQATLAEYRLLPRSWAGWVSVVLIIAEVAAIGVLLPAPSRQAGALLAGLLFTVYAAAMAINLLKGRSRIDCGCGNPGQAISWWLVSRNAALILLCVAVALPNQARVSNLSEALAAAGCILVLWLLALAFEQLLSNRHHARETSFTGSY